MPTNAAYAEPRVQNNHQFPPPPGQHEQADCHVCFFKPHCLPAELDGEPLAHFERSVWRQRRPLRAGQVLVRQGDTMDSLYALRVGSVKAYIDEASGMERVVGFRFPGAILGLAEPEQERWLRTFVALEDTWVCRIPLHSLDDTLRRQLVRLMSRCLRQEYDSHLTLAFKSGTRKVASFLLEISANFSARGLSARRFHLPMNYMDVASYLGMRHESVSRTLSKLQESGLLEKNGKYIHLKDFEGLQHVRED